MRRDAQVRACLTTKRLSVLSETATVYPANDTPEAKQVASLVEAQLANVTGGIVGLLDGALDALVVGWAIGEYIFDKDSTLRQIIWHDPRRFELLADEYGEVIAVRVRDMPGLAPLPVERFVLYTYQGRYGNQFGESDLASAYEPFARKQALLRMWMVALDRFGTPPVVATAPVNWTQDEMNNLASQLAGLQTQSAMVVPEGVKVEFDMQRVEPGAGFASAVAYQDTQIARAILGQELTTQAGSGSGSYALGRVHQAVSDDWVQSLRSDLAMSLLTGQVAKTLTHLHFGPNAPVPKIAFANLTESELSSRREVIQALVEGNVVAPNESWLRAYLGVPEAEVPDGDR